MARRAWNVGLRAAAVRVRFAGPPTTPNPTSGQRRPYPRRWDTDPELPDARNRYRQRGLRLPRRRGPEVLIRYSIPGSPFYSVPLHDRRKRTSQIRERGRFFARSQSERPEDLSQSAKTPSRNQFRSSRTLTGLVRRRPQPMTPRLSRPGGRSSWCGPPVAFRRFRMRPEIEAVLTLLATCRSPLTCRSAGPAPLGPRATRHARRRTVARYRQASSPTKPALHPQLWRDNQDEKRATIRMRIDVATRPRVT